MAGYGIGNVVLPPLVRKYFPDRIGVVTAGYVTLLAVGMAMSPQFSVPLADAAAGGYRWRSGPRSAPWCWSRWAVQAARDRRKGRTYDGGAPASPGFLACARGS